MNVIPISKYFFHRGIYFSPWQTDGRSRYLTILNTVRFIGHYREKSDKKMTNAITMNIENNVRQMPPIQKNFKHVFPTSWEDMFVLYLQCFDAVGWAAGRASGL